MSESTTPPDTGVPKQAVKQRALNALIFLLAVAVCVQGFMLWEIHERLNKAVAQIERNGLGTASADWRQMTPPDRSEASPTPPGTPASQPANPANPSGPFAQNDPLNWDPFREMDRMRQEIDRMMGKIQTDNSFAPQVGGVSRPVRSRAFSVEDQDNQYVVNVSLPGTSEADVSVSVENQVLRIVVQHDQTVQNPQPGRSVTQERISGRSEQRLPLPTPVDGAHLKSSFSNGILTVIIPKALGPAPESHDEPSGSVRGN